jgi:hypothetical protein
MTAAEIRELVSDQMQLVEANGLLRTAVIEEILLAEIAAQLAEMNERNAHRATHRSQDGEPSWECKECGVFVYSEDHYKQHLIEHANRKREYPNEENKH